MENRNNVKRTKKFPQFSDFLSPEGIFLDDIPHQKPGHESRKSWTAYPGKPAADREWSDEGEGSETSVQPASSESETEKDSISDLSSDSDANLHINQDKRAKMTYKSDPVQTLESAHDSSSGIASDVVSGHSGQYPSPKMTTCKGGDHDDPSSTDSSFSHGRSSWSSPSTKGHHNQHHHHHHQQQHHLHRQNHINQECLGSGIRMSPRPPLSHGMYKSQHMDARIDLMTNEFNHMDLHDTDRLIMKSSKGKRHHLRLSPFDLLSDDVIVKIFSSLPTDSLCRCSRVCHRWYRLVWDPTLWTAIVINTDIINIDKALRVLTKRLSYETPSVCVIVEKMNLNGCEKLTDRGLHIIAKRCPELRHLELHGCANVTNTALFEVVSYCVNLEYLNVTGCPNITCISLLEGAISPSSPHHLRQIYLRHLDMTDCTALEDEGLQIISLHCTQLQFLYLRRCVRVSDRGLQFVAHYCSSLRELSVSDCRRVTDFGMRELSKLDSNLRYLSVAKCDKISDVGIKFIAKHCTRLRYLNVRGCEAVSDDSLELLAQNCTRLKSLDVGKCDVTDEGLQVLAQNCPQLKRLSLKSCDAITDEGIIQLAYHCQALQQLNIQDCHLTAQAYRTVKKYCRKCIIEHTNPGFCI